jgi:oxygen-independent coproporphyrinogen-3 oxidase
MFAVPGQAPSQWRTTLEKTIALRPEHVSSYCLTYEEDTDYFRRLGAGDFRQDDERDAQFFEATIDALTGAGLAHYEISNYARPGHESAHNRAYWLGADYLGFGPGAFSTVGVSRWENIRDTAGYTRRILGGESAAGFREELTPRTRAGEIAAFRIRMADGMPRTELAPWSGAIAGFEKIGLLEESSGNLRLTRRGKLLADSVAEAFVETQPKAMT